MIFIYYMLTFLWALPWVIDHINFILNLYLFYISYYYIIKITLYIDLNASLMLKFKRICPRGLAYTAVHEFFTIFSHTYSIMSDCIRIPDRRKTSPGLRKVKLGEVVN